jgi:hypothetical protein
MKVSRSEAFMEAKDPASLTNGNDPVSTSGAEALIGNKL